MPTLDEVNMLPQGAVWLKADLHVHTPASKDISSRCSEATADDVVRIAIEKGLDLIAITDHNTASYCDAIQEGAKDTSLTVLPGVEITTPQGHVLAIFDVGTPASKIEDLLIKLGIPREQIASLEVATKLGFYDVCKAIEDENAVAIGAHVDGVGGFINMIKVASERKRTYESTALRGLEIIDISLRDKYQKGLASGYTRPLACIQSSDCLAKGFAQHDIQNMGSRISFIKMGERSISGLKLALIDPDMRIRLESDDNPVPIDQIIGMWVTGGFLNGQQFRFSDNVTCLIGDTGSGKSVCFELIRFVLNQQSNVPKIKHEVDSLLSHELGSLGTVHLIVKKENSYYLVERAWSTSPTPPTISRFLDGVLEAIEGEIDIKLFFPIKAFSQSEIIEFARESTVRLSLTDDLIDCTTEISEIKDIKLKLQKNAAELQVQFRNEERMRLELADLPTLIEDQKQIDSLLSDERIRNHHLWYKEKTLLEQAVGQFEKLEGSIPTCFSSIESNTSIEEQQDDYPNSDLVKELSSVYGDWQSILKQMSTSLQESAKALLEKVGSIKGRWDTRFIKAEAEYQQLIVEIDKEGKGLKALSDRKRRIDERIDSLRALEGELNTTVLPLIQSLESKRDSFLTKLQSKRKAITDKRKAKADELNKKLRYKIRLDVHRQANSSQFRDNIAKIAQGSGFRTADVATLAEKGHPISFVKRLLDKDYKGLSKEFEIEATWWVKYRENIFEKNRLDDFYELQLVDKEDIIEVMLDVGRSEYKPIEALAHGQKCMVVLMVALAEGQSPLLVDQPEDALHAPGIEEGIVSTLRSRRGVRQCIFATRNANIIVSADAEQILSLKADAIHGELTGNGCLDCYDQRKLVVYHVEGGDEAFQRRQTKYSLRPYS